MADGPANRYLPRCCTAEARLQKGIAIDVYAAVMNDPRGGDLPGARSALIGWIVLDRKHDVHNWVDDVFSRELKDATELMRMKDVDVVAVISAKASGFCAGASLAETYPLTDQAEIAKHVSKARAALEGITRLHCPSIAFMHGTCVGAGYELALMCTMRMGAEGSRIGFPDVKQGMIPALGGMTALPDVIGLKASIALIVHGKVLDTQDAYEQRLIDFLLPYPRLQERAYREINSLLWDCVTRSPTISLKRGCTRRDLWMEKTLPGKFYLKHHTIAAVDTAVKGEHPAPYVALSTMMTARFAKEDDAAAVTVSAATCLGASSWGKTFIRLKKVGAKLAEQGRQALDDVKATADDAAAVEAEEMRRRPLVVVGPVDDIAVVLGVALRRGGFCMLGARRAQDRVHIIDRISSTVDNDTLQEHLPRLHRTDSFGGANRPSASGYSVVGIVYDPKEDGERDAVTSEFISHIDSADQADDWLWAIADKSVPRPAHTQMVFNCSFFMTSTHPMVADLELPADPAVLTAAARKLNGMNCSVVARDAGSVERMAEKFVAAAAPAHAAKDARYAGVMDLLLVALYEAVSASGVAPDALDAPLGFPEGTCCGALGLSALARVGLAADALPKSADNVDAKVDKFLTALCNSLVQLAAAAKDAKGRLDTWVNLNVLDSLFVTALGWPAHIAGPCTIFDKKRLYKTDLGDYPALRDAVKAQGRLLGDHPLPNEETDRAAWALANSYHIGPAAVSPYDIVWPILAYCIYWIILNAPAWFATWAAGADKKKARKARHMRVV